MRLTIEHISENPTSLLRRAGYVFQRHDSDQMSFVRAFGRSGFPRFHIYATLQHVTLSLSLHLDHKKETYGSATQHHGDYDEDSEPLRQEVERLKKILH